ncbi:MAG: hypothetical protein ACOYM2_19970 [Rectinemataceae bacterium]
MLVDARKIVPITRLQKELTQQIRNLSASGEALFVLKNNILEAVIVPFAEYEHLMDLQEMFEYFEIDDIVQKRITGYDLQKNIPWEELR